MVLPYAENLDLRKGLSLGAFLQGLSMLVHAFVGARPQNSAPQSTKTQLQGKNLDNGNFCC